MKQLPPELITEKNLLSTTGAWIILLDVKFSESEVFYLARNNENVIFEGRTYIAFPFELDISKSTASGDIPNLTISISNVLSVLHPYIEYYKGGVGATVKLRVVSSKYLSANYSSLTVEYSVLSTQVDEKSITFEVGMSNPLRLRFPRHRYLAEYCLWDFKSAECGYSGSGTSCGKRLQDCENYNNTQRFGGFIGLRGGNVRLIE